jgi:tRNA-specific 2-thiouridylase
LRAVDLHWLGSALPDLPLTCAAKTRYRQADQACRITQWQDGVIDVEFVEPQRAVTPGQAVVFYDGDVCLGGGVIRTSDTLAQAA